MLNNKQLKYLKSLANNIDSKYQIGKNEVSDNTILLLENAIKKYELIKISVNTSVAEEKQYFAKIICEKLHAELVQVLGNTITIFRKNLKDGKIHLPN